MPCFKLIWRHFIRLAVSWCLQIILSPFLIISSEFFFVVFFEEAGLIVRRECNSDCTKFLIILWESGLFSILIDYIPFSEFKDDFEAELKITIAYFLGLGIVLNFKCLSKVVDAPVGLFALFIVLCSMDYLIFYPFVNAVDQWKIRSHHDFFEEPQGQKSGNGRSLYLDECLFECLID